jgi:hypothetical protein
VWSFEHTVETKAAPEAVWALWSDVSGWSSWDDDIEWATLEGPFLAGSRGVLKPKGVPPGAFELVSVVPGKSYTVEQRLRVVTLRFHHDLAEGPPTRFTHGVTVSGVLWPVFVAAFGRRMKKNFPAIMRQLAAVAEGRE